MAESKSSGRNRREAHFNQQENWVSLVVFRKGTGASNLSQFNWSLLVVDYIFIHDFDQMLYGCEQQIHRGDDVVEQCLLCLATRCVLHTCRRGYPACLRVEQIAQPRLIPVRILNPPGVHSVLPMKFFVKDLSRQVQ